MKYVVLSQDSGTANCGICITRYTKTTMSILHIRQITDTINNLTSETQYKNPTKAQRAKALKQGKKIFRKEDKKQIKPLQETFPVYYDTLSDLYTTYNVKDMVAERFQTRGTAAGPLIEQVSTMNSAMVSLAHSVNIGYRLVIASQWKVATDKQYPLTGFYEIAKKYGFSPHEADASLIGLYQAAYRGIIDFELGLSLWKKAIRRYAKSIK